MLGFRRATFKPARLAVLLLPAVLGGCYVVPIVPVGPPVYREYRGPYQGPYRGPYRGGYYRYGRADAPPATPQQDRTTQGTSHIEVASISR